MSPSGFAGTITTQKQPSIRNLGTRVILTLPLWWLRAQILSRLFISHSSTNDDAAIALKDWLARQGWSGPDDIFLDLDPEHGIGAGERWVRALEDAATRCEAVLFL